MSGQLLQAAVAANSGADETASDCKCQKQRGGIPADDEGGHYVRWGVGL